MKKQSFNRPLIVGKRVTSDVSPRSSVTVTAAEPRKAVYCIDNLSQSTTDTSLRKFVESLGVCVISCFEVKPRLSQWQRQRKIQPKRKTFRLCINRVDSERLLIVDFWAEDISISKWFFKAPSETTSINDKQGAAGTSASAGSKDTAHDKDITVVDADETIMATDPAYSAESGMASTPT